MAQWNDLLGVGNLLRQMGIDLPAAPNPFGGGGSGAVEPEQDPIEAQLNAQQKPKQIDPQAQEKAKQFFKSYGYSDQDIEHILAMDPKEQDRFARDLMKSKAPRPPRVSAAKQPYDRSKLEDQFPEYKALIEAAPEGSIANIATMLFKRQQDGEKPTKQGAFRIDRQHLPAGLQKYAPYMTDETISGIAKSEYQKSQEGSGDNGGYWPKLKGHSLKIVQDDAFKRSGLSSGDTVCIKIP